MSLETKTGILFYVQKSRSLFWNPQEFPAEMSLKILILQRQEYPNRCWKNSFVRLQKIRV